MKSFTKIIIGVTVIIGIIFLFNFNFFNFDFLNFGFLNQDKNYIACGEFDCAIEELDHTLEGEYERMEGNTIYFKYGKDLYATKLVFTSDYQEEAVENFLVKGDELVIDYEYIENGFYYSWVTMIDDNKKEFLLQDLLLEKGKVTLLDEKGIWNRKDLVTKYKDKYPNINVTETEDNTDFSLFSLGSIDVGESPVADKKEAKKEEKSETSTSTPTSTNKWANNKEIFVEACDLGGDREPNVKVDIGFDSNYADREYYAYTNEYEQLVYVEANEIILQNDDKEKKLQKGDKRYCYDEAEVDGVESSTLDEGHAIADSLGGVSNAYNITPQDSYLNRHGEQYQMEEDIRKLEANGKEVTEFRYYIEYPNTKTMTPSKYYGSYKVNGNTVEFSFVN